MPDGQTSEWSAVKPGVPQGSLLGQMFLLIYINDLSHNLVSTVKHVAHDTSLLSVVHDSNITTNELNNNLQKISEWVYTRKMPFNSDLNKQVRK